MEDKESTESDSQGGNSELDSPPSSDNGGAFGGDDDIAASGFGGGVIPPTMNMGVDIDMEENAGVMGPLTLAVGGGIIGGGGGEVVIGKRKRGRPRKYDSDGNIRPGYVAAQPVFALLSPPSSYGYTSGAKRRRGRSSGSGNWASLSELFLNTARGDFVPHVLTVYAGEDVAGKILAFAQKCSRGICVLSANGSISNVTILQTGSSGGLLTYEGRFEILSLMGSYTFSDKGGMKSRSGGLSVSLASPDGRVIGGGVAGLLMAANPIQIVVGSFEPNGLKTPRRRYKAAPKTASIQVSPATATVTAATPISQAPPPSSLYVMPMSQSQVQNHGETDESLMYKNHQNLTSSDAWDWNDPGPTDSDQIPSPGLNMSLPID